MHVICLDGKNMTYFVCVLKSYLGITKTKIRYNLSILIFFDGNKWGKEWLKFCKTVVYKIKMSSSGFRRMTREARPSDSCWPNKCIGIFQLTSFRWGFSDDAYWHMTWMNEGAKLLEMQFWSIFIFLGSIGFFHRGLLIRRIISGSFWSKFANQ